MQNLKTAIPVLDQRSQAFDPIAVVAVERAVDGAHLGTVDVPAHHAVQAALAGFGGHGFQHSPATGRYVAEWLLDGRPSMDLSLFEPIFAVLEPQMANWRLTRKLKPRTGSRSTNAGPRNAYRCKDGLRTYLGAIRELTRQG